MVENMKLRLTICLLTLMMVSLKGGCENIKLDADNNGLYNDSERMLLLEKLQLDYPELQDKYDQNNDGKITVLEQTAGKSPLSVLISKYTAISNSSIPWALNLFPEWLMTAYFQEDVESGQISHHLARGSIKADAIQENYYRQPTKLKEKSGIEFTENSGEFLSMPGQRDARWNYRWCIFTFRIDANSGSANETILLDINQGDGGNKSSPKIWYNKESGLKIQYVGLKKDGLDKRIMVNKDKIIADGKTWNIIVTGIRYGKLFASINGNSISSINKQPDHFSGSWVDNTTSYIGDKRKTNMAWAYDTLAFGLTEPSEAMVDKMTGWAAHRLDSQANLPNDHPYKVERPLMDKEDFPYRYLHDNEKWTQWGEAINYNATRINAGNIRIQPKDFERVFYDDFRRYRIHASNSGEADLWASPGFNIAVGADAKLISSNEDSDAYAYNSKDKKQTISLIKKDKVWRGSAFYSINDLGYGYTWKGPKIFRIRSMFPKIAQEDLPGGLFPAFWSYDPDFLFWRTANRIEVDWFEFDGQKGGWYNGLASHYHYVHLSNIFAQQTKSYPSYKVYSGELTEIKSNIEGGIYLWDGNFHTWEFVVDNDMTYVNVTIKDKTGKDKWVEVARVQTPATYLERLDLQLNFALISKHGLPTTDRQDFVIDWIEVLQKTEQLAEIPEPFISLPELTGETIVGSTITCNANLLKIKDIRYYWFVDGYPLSYTINNTYKPNSADKNKKLRCMVKAVGAVNMPEAWSKAVVIGSH